MAACIRAAIELFLHQADTEVEDLSDIAGRFRPISMDGLKAHDQHWADAALDGRRTS